MRLYFLTNSIFFCLWFFLTLCSPTKNKIEDFQVIEKHFYDSSRFDFGNNPKTEFNKSVLANINKTSNSDSLLFVKIYSQYLDEPQFGLFDLKERKYYVGKTDFISLFFVKGDTNSSQYTYRVIQSYLSQPFFALYDSTISNKQNKFKSDFGEINVSILTIHRKDRFISINTFHW